VSIESTSGSIGVPERVQFHLGTRRVPSSSLNMPVWGMLIRLAGWRKGTLGIVIVSRDRRSFWKEVGDGRGLVFSVPSFLGVHPKPMNQMFG